MFIVMKYKIRLENLENGQEAMLEVPAHLCVETLSHKIKMALNLPYTDHAWHRFVARGITYVVNERVVTEPELLKEYGIRPGRYRSSERISIERIFTSIGSSIQYRQDKSWGMYVIRCTFLQRIL